MRVSLVLVASLAVVLAPTVSAVEAVDSGSACVYTDDGKIMPRVDIDYCLGNVPALVEFVQRLIGG